MRSPILECAPYFGREEIEELEQYFSMSFSDIKRKARKLLRCMAHLRFVMFVGFRRFRLSIEEVGEEINLDTSNYLRCTMSLSLENLKE